MVLNYEPLKLIRTSYGRAYVFYSVIWRFKGAGDFLWFEALTFGHKKYSFLRQINKTTLL
jgi:hypothetical protein